MKLRPSLALATLALAAGAARAIPMGTATEYIERHLRSNTNTTIVKPSFNITTCPGYKLAGTPRSTQYGWEAQLRLAGEACHAFGFDIKNLTVAVVSEKKHQLHVHIYDSDRLQYQLPNGLLFHRPNDSIDQGYPLAQNDLRFQHRANATPWEWWIERSSTGEIIFDTRQAHLPTYTEPMGDTSINGKRNSTAMPAHPLVFENQYLQLSSALPQDASLYGLGEYVTGSLRRDPNNTLQTFFTHDAATPVRSNMYGYHPVYMEARKGPDGRLRTHGVYLQSTAGLDVLLRPGVIQYRAIGGTLDLRFFSGDAVGDTTPQSHKPDDHDDHNDQNDHDGHNGRLDRIDHTSRDNSATTAIEQYINFVGTPMLPPLWSLGFHMCRWGYHSLNDTRDAVVSMKKAGIPLETIWNDIDYMHEFRDFTVSPSFEGLGDYVRELNAQGQHYIPILDAAIPDAPTNDTDEYWPATRGRELDVFLKNANGSLYVGEVWPGYALFVDHQAPNATLWWDEVIANFSALVPFSGLWLDMNEQSSFVPGNAADSKTNLSDTPSHVASTSVAGWPQGYNNLTWGSSGNMTVNGSLTYAPGPVQNNAYGSPDLDTANQVFNKAFGPDEPDFAYENATTRFLDNPPYAIHNGLHYMESPLQLNLDKKTVAMETVGVDGKRVMYDVHNLDGSLMEKHVHNAVAKLRPDQRPFLISRSTYPGANRYTGHWLGDNFSLWKILKGNETYTAGAGMSEAVDGMLSFSMFGFSSVGPDIGGFNRNADMELVIRWLEMGAFSPFARVHNTEGAIAQEPYRWDESAAAARKGFAKRYELLPTLYSLMAQASIRGTPALRALWYDFPDVFDIARDTSDARQFLWGDTLLVTPVFAPNVSEAEGVFPDADGAWYNVFSYEPLSVESNKLTNISAPLGEINVHLRPARALLTHQNPQYTTNETTKQPYGLILNLDRHGAVSSSFYLDDGTTPAPRSINSTLIVESGRNGQRHVDLHLAEGSAFKPVQPLTSIVLLNVESSPTHVSLSAQTTNATFSYDSGRRLLNVTDIRYTFQQNEVVSLTWE